MGYMTVTCHFISEEWVFESFVLETAHIDVEHTAVNLSSELRRITDKWNISNKIHCVTTDNAKNIRNAVTQQKWNNLPCFAHTLNLIVTNAIKGVDELTSVIESVKKIVTFFHTFIL